MGALSRKHSVLRGLVVGSCALSGPSLQHSSKMAVVSPLWTHKKIPGVGDVEENILRRAFAMYDVDGDGSISTWEFQRLLSVSDRIGRFVLEHSSSRNQLGAATYYAKLSVQYLLQHFAY